jgi:SAM-dependent methyltransferase
MRSLLGLCVPTLAAALTVCGLDLPNAKNSPASRALDSMEWPDAFPFSQQDLTPQWAGNDGSFYVLPKFVQHAGDECRDSLSDFYARVLPPSDGDVLDLCSSFTSHYPESWKGRRCVVLGLNPLELVANPSKTEWVRQNLNENPTLPFDDASFDVITNSLSVDYMTRPLELFSEMARVLRPGGIACMAFTNRCCALNPFHRLYYSPPC